MTARNSNDQEINNNIHRVSRKPDTWYNHNVSKCISILEILTLLYNNVASFSILLHMCLYTTL